eukprot:GFUD01062977.1.p1 GENE.GFUD01062977.1~~GFUD01062977.1.p1  ORF type:complete len:116 (-),score=26.78 GFUD01062977.1:393-740(-)
MERKKSFQSKSRFERAKTPMGAVPISVIMGFDYPLGDTEPSGRGEAPPSYNYRSSYSSGYSSDLNTNYMNTNMLERLARPAISAGTYPWSATPSGSRTTTQKSYLGRARTEVRQQ